MQNEHFMFFVRIVNVGCFIYSTNIHLQLKTDLHMNAVYRCCVMCVCVSAIVWSYTGHNFEFPSWLLLLLLFIFTIVTTPCMVLTSFLKCMVSVQKSPPSEHEEILQVSTMKRKRLPEWEECRRKGNPIHRKHTIPIQIICYVAVNSELDSESQKVNVKTMFD